MRRMALPSTARASDNDLTAKARIRNAALTLYAQFGEDATSMRAIAQEAGVTGGLVVHHFGSKDGLRDAVEEYVVELFARAIGHAEAPGDPRALVRARDAAVADMLEANPLVVAYLRRAVLDDTGHRGRILEMLTDLTARQVSSLRSAGLASTEHSLSNQVTGILVRQLGHLFLQPLVDRTWAQLAEPDTEGNLKPELVIKVVEPAPES